MFERCEKLRFLLRGLSAHQQNDDCNLEPQYQSLQPLMDSFAGLDRVAKQECASREKAFRGSFGWHSKVRSTVYVAGDLLPPRPICDVLLDAYISTFESVLRILYVPSFLRDYEKFWGSSWSRSMDSDGPFACKLLIAIAVGSSTFQSPYVPPNQVRSWIAHVRQWLASKMIEGSRLDVDMAQIMCLLALARHTHQDTFSPGTGWFPGDPELTRVGIQMGLHREPRTHSPAISVMEAEIRRRLWATMLELSLQLCFDEGLPAPISTESYDCEVPANIADEDIASGMMNGTLPSTSPELLDYKPSTLLVLLGRTQRLRLRILHLINSPGASQAFEDRQKLAAELIAACCADSNLLHSMKKPTSFQIMLFHMFTWPLVLAVHGPFADQAMINPAYYYSRKMRMEVSTLLISSPLLPVTTTTNDHGAMVSGSSLGFSTNPILPISLSNKLPYDPTQTSTAATRTPISPLFEACAALRMHGHGHFAIVQRQATTALCLDLINELEEDAFPITDGARRRQLSHEVQNAVKVFERRVRAASGTHSTYEFIFFSCAEAYIETMLQGRKIEADEAISKAARAALAFCCEVMERQQQVKAFGSEWSGQSEEDLQLWMHEHLEDALGQ